MLATEATLDQCERTRRRLAEHIDGLVDDEGDIRDTCASRILESALLLDLLRKRGALPKVQEELLNYLRTTRLDAAGELKSTLFLSIIKNSYDSQFNAEPDQIITRLQEFHMFTGTRKDLLIRAILQVLGIVPLRSGHVTDPEQIRYGGYQAWTNLSLCAIRLLYMHALGRPSPDDSDLAYLRANLQQAPGHVWQGNALNHLIPLHALHVWCPTDRLIDDGIGSLVRSLNPDGGMPFEIGQQGWIAPLGGSALATSPRSPERGKLLTRIGDFIAGLQHDDGAWATNTVATQTDVDDSAKCAQALRLFDTRRYRDALTRVEDYLALMPGPDGGFPTYLKGHDSEPEMTAEGIITLAPVWRRHTTLLQDALAYLLSAQRDDGAFDLSWTLSASSVILHAVDAFDVAGRLPLLSPRHTAAAAQAITKATAFLETTQNDDGGWGHQPDDPSDVLSTVQAIPVIVRHAACRQGTCQRALDYLIAQRNEDGTFLAPPDQVAPRPIPYEFPELVNIHTLLAFNCVLDRPGLSGEIFQVPCYLRPSAPS